MLDVEGFILVGGLSSRMGRDKSQLVIRGRTTVELISTALQPLTRKVSLVGARPESSTASLPNIPDRHHQWGPLGGIHAALHQSQSQYCIAVACDLPFVTSALFAHLISSIIESGFDAVVPMQSDGRPQPLCAIYKRDSCLRATERAITNHEHMPRAMLDQVKTKYLDFSELSDLPNSDQFFINLNRPEDYDRVK